MNARLLLLFGIACIGGCATTTPVDLGSGGTQLEARQIQTRQYDTLDKALTMRSVVATLQDLGFTIDQADTELGTITATRYDEYTMRMTAVTDALTYQDFFVALDKAMFLTLQRVD
jgi:hypothetical protein